MLLASHVAIPSARSCSNDQAEGLTNKNSPSHQQYWCLPSFWGGGKIISRNSFMHEETLLNSTFSESDQEQNLKILTALPYQI